MGLQLTRAVTRQERLRNKVCGWLTLRPKLANPVHAHLSPPLSPSSQTRRLGREPEKELRVNTVLILWVTVTLRALKNPKLETVGRLTDEGIM